MHIISFAVAIAAVSGLVSMGEARAASWTVGPKLLASDGAPGDRFGGSVALSGDIALIGAPGDDDNGERSGAAYLATPTPVPLPAGVWLLAFRGKRA